MKLFKCQNCGNTIHFNNDVCLVCNSRIGYVRKLFDMSALTPNEDGSWNALADPGQNYFFCENATEGACNWLVPADSPERFDFTVKAPEHAWARRIQDWSSR